MQRCVSRDILTVSVAVSVPELRDTGAPAPGAPVVPTPLNRTCRQIFRFPIGPVDRVLD